MWRRFLLAVLLPLLVPGCATDDRQVETCRKVFATLAGWDLHLAAATTAEPGTVRLHGTSAAGAAHDLTCRFAGRPRSAHQLELAGVEFDGAVFSEIRLALLRNLLGIATPAPFLEKPAPTLGRRGAYLAQQLINGLSIGAILALVATGYSLVYGITGTIQFAYGELFMIGAFMLIIPFFGLAALGSTSLGVALLVALPVAGTVTACYGWTMARLVYRPLFHANRLNALIAAIGLAIAFREFVRIVQGSQDRWLPQFPRGRFILFEGGGFSVYVAHTQIIALTLAVGLALALAYLMMHTSWGRAHRACADDPDMAALLGVDIHGTIGRTFALGAALAAIAGTIFTLQYGEADAYMGYLIGFKALTAALLGGFGTVTGALLGGLFIGLVEALWAGYFGSSYTDVAVFSLLVLVLVFRPDGLAGRNIVAGWLTQPGAFRRT